MTEQCRARLQKEEQLPENNCSEIIKKVLEDKIHLCELHNVIIVNYIHSAMCAKTDAALMHLIINGELQPGLKKYEEEILIDTERQKQYEHAKKTLLQRSNAIISALDSLPMPLNLMVLDYAGQAEPVKS